MGLGLVIEPEIVFNLHVSRGVIPQLPGEFARAHAGACTTPVVNVKSAGIKKAAGAQNAREFMQNEKRLLNMAENINADNGVEGVVEKRKMVQGSGRKQD